MTDLWDWADVAAVGYIVGLYVGATPANVLMGYVPGPRSQFAAAIRYGYEQAQRDTERATHVTAVATSEFDWDRYFPLNPQPESTAAQDEQPVAASEFPRVWVDIRVGVKTFYAHSEPVRPLSDDLVECGFSREQYVHISELERLREAARKAYDGWAGGRDIWGPMRELEKAIGE